MHGVHHFSIQSTLAEHVHITCSKALPGTGSVLDAFSWSQKNAPQPVVNPIACFCAAADGMYTFP